MNAEPEVIEAEVSAGLSVVGDTEIDIQVATARRFPRSLQRFMQKAQEMATLTPEIAASCIYAVPRDGKTIEGPSARFAEVMASAWGNMRAEGKTLGDDGEYVTSRGTSWDIENNVAIAFEVKRRITNRRGETYNADMITVTGNAGASIALRNAILKNIPTPFWKPIYNACRKVVAGDAKTFASRRDNMLHEFGVMGVTEARLCAALNLKGKLDITLEHMATLTGFFTALKDGDTTIEEAFPDGGGLNQPVKPAQRKSEQASDGAPVGAPVDRSGVEARSREMPSTAAGTVGGPAPSSAKADGPNYIGIIADVIVRDAGSLIKLDTGFQCATRDDAFVRAAQSLRDAKTRVELVTKAANDLKYAPRLIEISRRRAMTSGVLSFDAAVHEYRLPDGQRVPSVTEILGAVGVAVDFEMVGSMSSKLADDIEAKRQLGTAVHLDAHAFDDDDLDWDTVDPRVEPYVRAWATFRANKRLTPMTRERRVFHPTYFYCGTLDGIFLTPAGTRVLVDIKTGDPVDSGCRFQTAAYQAAYAIEHPDEPISERWAVRLTPALSVPYRVTPYDDWRDFSVFQAFVTTFQHQSARRRALR